MAKRKSESHQGAAKASPLTEPKASPAGRRANPRRDRAQSRTRQLPSATQASSQVAGSPHPLHLLPLGPAPGRPRHRRRRPPLGAGRAVSPAAAALAAVLQGLHRKQEGAAGVLTGRATNVPVTAVLNGPERKPRTTTKQPRPAQRHISAGDDRGRSGFGSRGLRFDYAQT
jgi:hypothetical protein